jgi:hypothetical protein
MGGLKTALYVLLLSASTAQAQSWQIGMAAEFHDGHLRRRTKRPTSSTRRFSAKRLFKDGDSRWWCRISA